MLKLKVKVNYPTDPQTVDKLETRGANAFAKIYANMLPPEKFDELILKLKESM